MQQIFVMSYCVIFVVFHLYTMWLTGKGKKNLKKNYYRKPLFQVLIKIDKILYGDIARCSFHIQNQLNKRK